jgi:putative phage-type endonuclease
MQAVALLNTKEMSREEWLDQRKKGLGGSDAAAILGLNKYFSPFDVYADKLGLKPEKEDNEAMRQGRDLEGYVAARFMDQTGKKVRRRNAILQHPNYPWMLANVDRMIVGEDCGLECKTTSILNKSNFRAGEYPDNYYVQCMHYMAVTGLPKWYLAVLVLGKEFCFFEIDRDEDEIKALIEAEKYFWEEHVLKGIPPAFDGSQAASDCLKAMYPKAEKGEVRPLFGMEERLNEYLDLSQRAKDFETKVEQIKQEIQCELGTAEEGLANGFKVEWKNRSRTNFDTKKLQKELPEVYQKYLKPASTYRVFSIKEMEV